MEIWQAYFLFVFGFQLFDQPWSPPPPPPSFSVLFRVLVHTGRCHAFSAWLLLHLRHPIGASILPLQSSAASPVLVGCFEPRLGKLKIAHNGISEAACLHGLPVAGHFFNKFHRHSCWHSLRQQSLSSSSKIFWLSKRFCRKRRTLSFNNAIFWYQDQLVFRPN